MKELLEDACGWYVLLLPTALLIIWILSRALT
jgi:hypothetical protein